MEFRRGRRVGCFSYTLLNRIGAAETLRLLEHRVLRVLFDRESLAVSNIDGSWNIPDYTLESSLYKCFLTRSICS